MSLPTPPAIFTIRCHCCSKQRFAHDIQRLPGNVKICRQCWEGHLRALAIINCGGVPAACGECGATYESLEAHAPDGNVFMTLHMKDGIYQFLCLGCSEKYVQKRRDLYGDTPFGHRKGLR